MKVFLMVRARFTALVCASLLVGCLNAKRPATFAEACADGKVEHCRPEVCAEFEPDDMPAGCLQEADGDASDHEDGLDDVVDIGPGLPETSDGTGTDEDSEPSDQDASAETMDSETSDQDASAETMDAEADTVDCTDLDGLCVVGVWDGGQCVALPNGGVACDDGDPCTEVDTCTSAGECLGTVKDCSDALECTVDTCEGASGECTHDSTGCECFTDSDCDDGEPCSKDLCNSDNTCAWQPEPDGDACVKSGEVTVNGLCVKATCFGIRAAAAGGKHTCAVTAEEEVVCWGDNTYGQLGIGSTETVGLGPGTMPPTAVQLGGPAKAVATGGTHTCALMLDGIVRCWGNGFSGQLGSADNQNLLDSEGEEASIVPLNGEAATAISVGSNHSCALMANGAIRCWGYGEYGQLGSGSTQNVLDGQGPSQASTVPLSGETAVAVAAGGSHTCALIDDGKVRCWGDGQYGQLGSEGTQNILDGVGPGEASVVPLGGEAATAVAAGAYHTCALMANGGVRCWGLGSSGQLGSGDTQSLLDGQGGTQASIVPLGGEAATAVVAGSLYACALMVSGSIRCWGKGSSGQLGTGSTQSLLDGKGGSDPSSVPLEGIPAVSMAAGGIHMCARLANGHVVCWGAGADGRLGAESEDNLGDDAEDFPLPAINVMGAPGSKCSSFDQCLTDVCAAGTCGAQ